MPQKNIFRSPPILTAAHCFPVAGTIRTDDKRIIALYHHACQFIDIPGIWEGLFRIACLTKNNPLEESVTKKILQAIEENPAGSFPGSISEQISIARAAFALFEYCTDRKILKRIALWLRYLENEYDRLSIQNHILFSPADLMELLIRFYQISRTKTALRLCDRIRMDAYDWTTALHTLKQSVSIHKESDNILFESEFRSPPEIDYDTRQKMLNHAELLADGVRFTLFAGMFSGHKQDLKAGKTAWDYLLKYHHAVCGGTTGNPYLCGSASDQPVSSRVLCAWTEAFASQMVLPDSEWALEELIRVVFNGMEDILTYNDAPDILYVNTVGEEDLRSKDPAALYARLTRAVASCFSHAVSLAEKGIRINYLLSARFLVKTGEGSLLIDSDPYNICFRCKKPSSVTIDLFHSLTENDNARFIHAGEKVEITKTHINQHNTGYIKTSFILHNGDSFQIIPDGRILSETIHHQGLIFIKDKRLLCAAATRDDFSMAVCGMPEMNGEEIFITVARTDEWKLKGNQPDDIPVLPQTDNHVFRNSLISYAGTRHRITVFPRSKNQCLK